MSVSGDIYERELKSLLAGDERTISKITRTCNPTEKSSYNMIVECPFLVIRAAGSLGVDIVALRWDISFPIEVKSSIEDVLHFSKNQHLSDQADRMLSGCIKSHLLPLYAYRLKSFRGDPWRIFTIPTNHIFNGYNNVLYQDIPKLDISNNGKYIMRWCDGMKLSNFITHISQHTKSTSQGI